MGNAGPFSVFYLHIKLIKKVLILQHNLIKYFNRIHHFLTLIFPFLMFDKVTYETPLINSHF